MTRNRFWMATAVLVVSCAWIAGCTPPPEQATQTVEDTREDVSSTSESILPTPPPIIDIIEDGGQITYRYEKTSMDTGSPTTDRLDARMFKQALRMLLVDSKKATMGKKEYWPIDVKLEIQFTNSSGSSNGSVEIIRSATTGKLSWVCKAANGTTTSLVEGNALEIPSCMLKTGGAIGATQGSTTYTGDIVMIPVGP